MVAAICNVAAAQPVRVHPDAVGEARIRRTDWGGAASVGPNQHAIPDLIGYQIGKWEPLNRTGDLFAGNWQDGGGFLRVDLGFKGFINPPGPLAQQDDNFAPYLYGQSPAFGFVEFDVDRNVATGGEVGFPELRYLANVARFGGKPSIGRYADRVVLNPADFDNTMSTPPYYERSGEEFHLALFGDRIESVFEITGDGDGVFDPGEKWIVRGRLFHRAHGFERFNINAADGPYELLVDLQYDSSIALNLTFVSLVVPLTNADAASVNGDAVEPNDDNAFNQASVAEALANLINSANSIPQGGPLANDPAYALIRFWANQNVATSLHPEIWHVNVLVGMAYEQLGGIGELFAPTDVSDDPLIGDFNGDARVDCEDQNLLAQFILTEESSGFWDADGVQNGAVVLANFGPHFSVFDLNYDGVIDSADGSLVIPLGDLDFDCDVDTDDLVLFVTLLVSRESFSAAQIAALTPRADFRQDGVVNGADIRGFTIRFLAE